jgi:cytoskeletal protein CcmA (bactofilin family)
MQKNKILQIFSLLTFTLFATPFLVTASDFRSGEQVSLSSEEIISEDLYMSGSSVVSSGTVQGDLVTAGATLILNGSVLQDLLAAGADVSIKGDVADDVRAAGGNISIQGNVAGDAVLAGGKIFLTGENIGGDLMAAGGVVHIESEVLGSAHIMAGEVYINSTISGDTKIYADKISLGPKAVIAGNLSYTAPDAIVMADGAEILGEVDFTQTEHSLNDFKEIGKAGIFAFLTFWLIAKFLMIFLGALLIAHFLRKYSRTLLEKSVDNPVQKLGSGLIIFIMLPVASIILLITIIGIPFGVIGLLAYVMLLIYTSIITPIVIGPVVKKWISKTANYEINWQTILLGTVIYFLLGIIPLVGWVIEFGITLIILSVLWEIKYSVIKDWQ